VLYELEVLFIDKHLALDRDGNLYVALVGRSLRNLCLSECLSRPRFRGLVFQNLLVQATEASVNISSSRKLKCSLDYATRALSRAAHAIIGKVASEGVKSRPRPKCYLVLA